MIGAHGPVPASAAPAARAVAVGVFAVLFAGCADGQDSGGPALADTGTLLLADRAPTAATEQEVLRSSDDGETVHPLAQVGTGGS